MVKLGDPRVLLQRRSLLLAFAGHVWAPGGSRTFLFISIAIRALAASDRSRAWLTGLVVDALSDLGKVFQVL